MKKLLLKIHRFIIIIPAVLHLTLIPMHTTSLVSLFTQLGGFAMFMFILVGLACFFNATRVSPNPTMKQLITSTLCLVVTISFGIWLCTFYTDGLSNELVKNKGTITTTLALSISLIGCYAAGIVTLFAAVFVKSAK